jgi:pyruvate,water dikinase
MPETETDTTIVRWFESEGCLEVAQVGGKNASLAEMIQHLAREGIRVPGGFASTAKAYRMFLEENELDARIREHLARLEQDADALAEVGAAIRDEIEQGEFPETLAEPLRRAYQELSRRDEVKATPVAVRSSATAEDLPEASFAGQQETYLNVVGADAVLDAVRRCYASLFTDRAIAYRMEQGFDHLDVALSAAVQKMVRAHEAGAGVMFTLDTDTGFPDVVVINAVWGLGENVVGGAVNPDEYRVFKPVLDQKPECRPILERQLGAKSQKMVLAKDGNTPRNQPTSQQERLAYVLSDEEILDLARWAMAIERHYGKPMDIEWAKDGAQGPLYVVQARPETVQSQKQAETLRTYALRERSEVLLTGQAIGGAIAAGPVRRLQSPVAESEFPEGGILVTAMTDPDWVPLMKRAGGIVTDHGGRTSHAAIVSRELGVPAVIGTESATDTLTDDQEVTLSCAEGDEGRVFEGALEFDTRELDLGNVPTPPVSILLNIASPGGAMRWWRLPAAGVGLARMEFIINRVIQVHPLALARFDEVQDSAARERIEALTRGYESKSAYFVDRLAQGIATIAASQHPDPVIVRMSDFKTNEYADLVGGSQFEPTEENPMLGFRGAARYYSDHYRDGFQLECQGIRRAREELGLDNIIVMIPFVRTPYEADQVLEALAEGGLVRGQDGLQVYMMCEVPSNVLLARQFARRFDGFSIGSNDLTQLVLGVDRDSALLSDLFDERDEAVKLAVSEVIRRGHEGGVKVGICGQAPSDYPDFAEFLVREGIDTMSLNPDSVLEVIEEISGTET